jgi:CP family cyanate transporter-like MFS transporter
MDPAGGLTYYQVIFVGVLVICMACALSLLLFPNLRTSVAAKIVDDRAAVGSGD